MLGLGLGLVQSSVAAAGVSSTTVWNDSTGTPASNTAFVISGGGTIATRSALASDADVFANNGHTTGVQSFIVTPNRTSGIMFIGLANASESNTNFIGGSANSVGIFNSDGNLYKGGGIVLSSAATIGNTTPITVILKNGKVYFQVSGVDVTGQNSTAETGGIAAPTGTLYPACDATGVCTFTLDATNWP